MQIPQTPPSPAYFSPAPLCILGQGRTWEPLVPSITGAENSPPSCPAADPSAVQPSSQSWPWVYARGRSMLSPRTCSQPGRQGPGAQGVEAAGLPELKGGEVCPRHATCGSGRGQCVTLERSSPSLPPVRYGLCQPLVPMPDSGGGAGVQPPLGTPVEHAQLGVLSPSAPACGLACDAPPWSGLTGL